MTFNLSIKVKRSRTREEAKRKRKGCNVDSTTEKDAYLAKEIDESSAE